MNIIQDYKMKKIQDYKMKKIQNELINKYNTLISILEKTPELNYLPEFEKLIIELNNKLNRLNDKELKILIAGVVNSGKSTFINLLYNRKLLMDSVVACRALRLEIKNSNINPDNKREGVYLLNNPNGKKNEYISIKKFQNDIFQNKLNNEEIKPRIQCTIYCKPGENSILNTKEIDISITEIEGINKDSEDQKWLWKSKSQFDCVLFLVRPGENITTDGMSFLKHCREHNKFTNIFIIMNQMDNVKTESQCNTIKNQLIKQVNENFPESLEQKLVHFISTKKDWEAIKNQEEPSIEYKNLKIRLNKFIFNDIILSKLSPCINCLKESSEVIFNFLSEIQKINDLKIDILNNIKKEKENRDIILGNINDNTINDLIKNDTVTKYLRDNTKDGESILKYIENKLNKFDNINEEIKEIIDEKLFEFFDENNLHEILDNSNIHDYFKTSNRNYICKIKKLINNSFKKQFSNLNSTIKNNIENTIKNWLNKKVSNQIVVDNINDNYIFNFNNFNINLTTDTTLSEQINFWFKSCIISLISLGDDNKRYMIKKINSIIFDYINNSTDKNEILEKIASFYIESAKNGIHKFFKNEFLVKFLDIAFKNLCNNTIYNNLNKFKFLLYNSDISTFCNDLLKDCLNFDYDKNIELLNTRKSKLSSKIHDIKNIKREIEKY